MSADPYCNHDGPLLQDDRGAPYKLEGLATGDDAAEVLMEVFAVRCAHGAISEPRCSQSGKNSGAHNRSKNVICVQAHGDENGAESGDFRDIPAGCGRGNYPDHDGEWCGVQCRPEV